MILNSVFFNNRRLQYLVGILTLPFVALAFKYIGRQFVLRMCAAVLSFCLALTLFEHLIQIGRLQPFKGELFSVVIIGGITLGVGVGLIIRSGGGVDGSEIVAIIVNHKFGFTVGQVILAFNVLIFAIAGLVQKEWSTALHSLLIYVVAYKVIDLVIQGFDETKSVMIISSHSRKISDALFQRDGSWPHDYVWSRGIFG